MNEAFLRTQMLLGADALDKLSRCHVAVFGLGGVGSNAAEILAVVMYLVMIAYLTFNSLNAKKE